MKSFSQIIIFKIALLMATFMHSFYSFKNPLSHVRGCLNLNKELLSSKFRMCSNGNIHNRIPANSVTLDINLISQQPELVISHMKSRRSDEKLLEKNIANIAELRSKRNALISEADAAKNIRKTISQDIGKLMKEGKLEEVEKLKLQVNEATEKANSLDVILDEINNSLDLQLSYLPNLLDDRCSI